MYDRKYLMERCLCMMIVYLELWKYIGYIYKKKRNHRPKSKALHEWIPFKSNLILTQ